MFGCNAEQTRIAVSQVRRIVARWPTVAAGSYGCLPETLARGRLGSSANAEDSDMKVCFQQYIFSKAAFSSSF
jgi:hypothetical protein